MSYFGRGLVVTLAWGVLAFGAVYPWAYWPLALACAGLGVGGAWATQAWTDRRVRHLALAVAVVLVAIAAQTVALPYWLIGILSPGVDPFLHRAAVGYHPAALHALSVDPAATAVVLALATGLGLLLLGAVRAIRGVPLDWLMTQVMGLGLTVAVIGIVQRALVDTRAGVVYGFWRTIDGGNPFGPFVNRNHFAGWMVMVLPPVVGFAAGLAARRVARPDAPRGVTGWGRWAVAPEGNRFLLVSSAALIMAAALVLTGSRSGLAAMAVAVATFGIFAARAVRARRARLALVAYLAVIVVGGLTWAGADRMLARFERAPEELHGRLGAWRDTVRIAADFPVFGVGLGGYRSAMLLYQTTDRATIYAQAHNDYLQLAAEGGLLVSVPAAALGLLVVMEIRRRLAAGDPDVMVYWVRRGAVAGLVGIAAQSCVEFSLQMPGNAVVFVVLAAIALHRPRGLTHAHRL